MISSVWTNQTLALVLTFHVIAVTVREGETMGVQFAAVSLLHVTKSSTLDLKAEI